jgi:hypothetical protein
MTDRELMQQALDALKDTHYRIIGAGLLDQDLLNRNFTVATALRERLAQEIALDRMAENARELGLDYEPMQPCAGRNCGSTNHNLHSAECFEDYEKATGMAAQQPDIEELEHENRLMRARNERLQAEVERLEEQSEKRQYHADHVVLEKGTNDCVCTHCGQRYHIHMPVPIGIMTAIVDAFLEAHHQCEKPEAA